METDTFQSFVNKKVNKINYRFAFGENCLIYLLSCKVCGMQPYGQAN